MTEYRPSRLDPPEQLRRLQIEVTTYCNLFCKECSRTMGLNAGTWVDNHLSQAKFERLIEHSLPAEILVLQGVGEPTLNPDMIGKITRLQLNRIKKRVSEAHGVPFEYSDAVVDTIVSRCQELESGGRMIDAIVTNSMLPDISGEFLRRMMEGGDISKVVIDVTDGEFTYAFD